ncbi:MAG: CocE/NonD family hydrolase [Crocinitomicaceae bacterium]
MKGLFFAISMTLAIITFAQPLTPTLNDIYIPVRDGAELEADVYIPDGVDSAEVILIQTPYNKDFFQFSLPMGVGTSVDDQPFIWVIVDWRGFYGSFPAADPDADRGEDGYDICQWISEQEWHKDRIGTWGPSALGGMQYQTARENHPNHTCAVPLVAHGHQSYDTYFTGGVLEEARLYQLDALGYGLSPIVLANPYDNIIWSAAASGSWFPSILKIPTLQIGGWYDHNIDKMMDFYTDSRSLADPAVQDEQWLLVGPWVHGGTGEAYVGSSAQGELDYPNAEFKSDTMAWNFMLYYLLDEDNGWDETAKITYYEMGGNDLWHYSNESDIHADGSDNVYLTQLGGLEAAPGVGKSTFVSDPNNPSPTIGGATLSDDLDQGPFDQSSLDTRDDVITFEVHLSESVAITGSVKVHLYVSADQPDCDIAIRLVDVYPDGRNMLITDGIQRMRFRGGDYTEAGQEFMEPGEVYEVDINLPFTNYTWLPGHKIKIYVSGNNSVRYHVNLQDGGEMYADGDGVNAEINIHHSSEYPSYVELPGDNAFLSTDEDEAWSNVSIYPNPAKDCINLEVETGTIQEYKIVDLAGRNVLMGVLNDQKAIEVSTLEPGLYILQLTDLYGRIHTTTWVKE